jgi:diguanylate cyclase (GGDEF)-like protein/PAS domain S-box-containing protein
MGTSGVCDSSAVAARPPRRLMLGMSSLRVKLFLAAILVQALMLAGIAALSIDVMTVRLERRAQLQLDEDKRLLGAALTGLLGRRDIAAIEALFAGARSEGGISYLVLLGPDGETLASAGWPAGATLPPMGERLEDDAGARRGRFDTAVAIESQGKELGTLRLGFSTASIYVARDGLVREAIVACGIALAVSALLIGMVSFLLTRNLEQLTLASDRVARGDLDVRLPVQSDDEIGRLSQSFNMMAEALRGRLEALAASEAKFHAIADYSYDCELWVGTEGRLIYINPRVYDMFGYTPEECLAMDNFPAGLVVPEDVERTVRHIRRALRGNTAQDFEFRARRKDGTLLWGAADWCSIFGPNREYLGIRISVRNVSQRKEAEQRLAATVVELRQAQTVQQQYLTRAQEEHARLSALLSAMAIGIVFVSSDDRIEYCNPAFGRLWGIAAPEQLIGRDSLGVLEVAGSMLARPDTQIPYILRLRNGGQISGSYEIQLADGRLITQRCHSVEDGNGRAVGHIWIYEDITRERQTAEQLIYLAERDSLTGLYNRHRFNEELVRMIADAQRGASRLALLFFDLDEFKYINDTFGHRAGDAMLIRVAGEVASQVRRNEILSRLGGDEFAILVPEISDNVLRVLAERIVRSIAGVKFEFENQSLRLTTSLGIAVYPDHAETAEELIAHADTAMYQAKESGKNGWRVYRRELDPSREIVSRLSWNDRIAHALEHDLLRLHFQGIYDAGNRSLAHLEVLVRMQDQEEPGRLLMPGQFIPFAEKSGRIIDIDRWVIKSSVELLADVDVPALAVNISGRSFDEPTLPQFIAEQLKRCGVAPSRLLVELTETSAVSDLHDARRFIEALRHTGCRTCLDDFGTGFSSFAYLKHLQADALKIDGLFIRDLPNDYDNQIFVMAIVAVAKGMRKTTIAECVEDRQTFEMLVGFGVDSVQGYYLERPHADHRVGSHVFPDQGELKVV